MNEQEQPQHELNQLVKECQNLVGEIARKRYAIKLLWSARDGLLLCFKYKESKG